MGGKAVRRPTDWHPLRESDPVPGEPEGIRDEVKHMKKVAEMLRGQAADLRTINGDDTLKGKYADKLRDECGDLEKHLRETAGRYERVHGHLTSWAHELEAFQGEADAVLVKAKAKDEEEQKKPEKEKPEPQLGDPESDPLHKYRKALEKIEGHRDERASHFAKKIRDQLDDVIKDSTWENIKGWVHKNAKWIKVVVDAVGWAATILGVVALFIPGLNVAVILLAAGAFVLATRILLVASGDASWMDVAMDSIGLLTMGAGRLGVVALKGANATTKVAATAGRLGKLKNGLSATKALRNQLQRTIATTGDDAVKQAARQQLHQLRRGIIDDAGRVSHDLPELSTASKIAHLGDDEAASIYHNISRNADAFPSAVTTADRVRAGAGYGTAVAATYVGTATDVGDKVFGQSDAISGLHDTAGTPDKPYSDTYNDWKGNTWKPAVGTHW